MPTRRSIVIVFKSDGMGVTGPEGQPLREALAGKFLALLADAGELPELDFVRFREP